jgi:hypothetical protein
MAGNSGAGAVMDTAGPHVDRIYREDLLSRGQGHLGRGKMAIGSD